MFLTLAIRFGTTHMRTPHRATTVRLKITLTKQLEALGTTEDSSYYGAILLVLGISVYVILIYYTCVVLIYEIPREIRDIRQVLLCNSHGVTTLHCGPKTC